MHGVATDCRRVGDKDCQSPSVDDARNEETPKLLRGDWTPAPYWFNPVLAISSLSDIDYGKRPIDCHPRCVIRFC